MPDDYAAIRTAEDEIESFKQDFLSILGRIGVAERENGTVEERTELIQKAHRSAVRYFSRVEKWVAESSYLRAQEDEVWRLSLAGSCKAVLTSYLHYWDFLGREAENLGVAFQEQFKPPDDAYWMMQGMVRIEYPEHWAQLREEFEKRGLPKSGFDDEKRQIKLRTGQMRIEKMTVEKWIAVTFGFVFITVLLVLTVWLKDPTPMQETTFRIVLALCAGAIGAVIPGVLKLQGNLGGFTIRAAGALALFFIVYFWNPATSSGQGQIGQLLAEVEAQQLT